MEKITILLFTFIVIAFSANNAHSRSANKPTDFTLTYSTVASGLSATGYTIISVPSGYIPDLNVASYPGTVFYLYYKSSTDSYIEVYKFPNPAAAEAASTPESCTQKWHSSAQTIGCFDPGKECKVIGNQDPEKIKVICCN